MELVALRANAYQRDDFREQRQLNGDGPGGLRWYLGIESREVYHRPASRGSETTVPAAVPAVIAVVKAAGPTCVVVADEHPGTLENRKIPFECSAEGMQCIRFQQLMLAEGWQCR